jgi:hypothetical protein
VIVRVAKIGSVGEHHRVDPVPFELCVIPAEHIGRELLDSRQRERQGGYPFADARPCHLHHETTGWPEANHRNVSVEPGLGVPDHLKANRVRKWTAFKRYGIRLGTLRFVLLEAEGREGDSRCRTQETRGFQEDRDSAGIVICPWTPGNRVVVCLDQEARVTRGSGRTSDDIPFLRRLSRNPLFHNLKSRAPQVCPDVLACEAVALRIGLCVPDYGEGLNVSPQPGNEWVLSFADRISP